MRYCIYILCMIGTFSSYCQEPKFLKIRDIFTQEYKNIMVKEDWENERICLISSSKSDTVTINNAVELDTVKVNIDKFVELVYKVRGGSGEHLRLTKVFCMNDNEFKESLSLLTSYESYSSTGIIQKNYSVTPNFSYKNGKYLVDLTETSKAGKTAVKKNYVLQFELNNLIFFSERVKGKAISICDDTDKVVNEYFRILLSKEAYIHYQNQWYQQGAKCYIKM